MPRGDALRLGGPEAARMHKHTIIAVVAVAAVAAGCGGGSDNTLTKSQVIKRGTVVCKAAEKRVETLPQLTVEHPFAKGVDPAVGRQARKFLAGYADALNYSRVGLLELRAPSQDKQLLDGYLRDIGKVVGELRAASKAPAARVEDQANAAFRHFEKASAQTAKYGFPKGVCQAG
jgi:hypothetical protein